MTKVTFFSESSDVRSIPQTAAPPMHQDRWREEQCSIQQEHDQIHERIEQSRIHHRTRCQLKSSCTPLEAVDGACLRRAAALQAFD